MTFTLGVGLFLAVFTYVLGGARVDVFLNAHALVLVAGGTLAALFVTAPARSLAALRASVGSIARGARGPEAWAADVASLSQDPERRLESTHPLIAYAQELSLAGVEPAVFATRLRQRADALVGQRALALAALRGLSKYPPALGMTGTVIGMVRMFSDLTPESRAAIGPNIAIAMTATFYGLALSNAILMPLADRIAALRAFDAASVDALYRSLLVVVAGAHVTADAERGVHDAAG